MSLLLHYNHERLPAQSDDCLILTRGNPSASRHERQWAAETLRRSVKVLWKGFAKGTASRVQHLCERRNRADNDVTMQYWRATERAERKEQEQTDGERMVAGEICGEQVQLELMIRLRRGERYRGREGFRFELFVGFDYVGGCVLAFVQRSRQGRTGTIAGLSTEPARAPARAGCGNKRWGMGSATAAEDEDNDGAACMRTAAGCTGMGAGAGRTCRRSSPVSRHRLLLPRPGRLRLPPRHQRTTPAHAHR